MLYAPQGLPEPNSPGFIEAVANAAFPVVKASGGRAFFLCTSLRAMRRMHELLQDRLEAAGPISPAAAGEGSKNELLERFRRLGNAILVGSQSFWEGVDVRGEALSLVVIDKAAVRAAGRPGVVGAHRAHEQGRPQCLHGIPVARAVINVKQGAGRLIRDESDRGVLMICDPRLITKALRQARLAQSAADETDAELSEVIDFFEAGAMA